MLLISFWTDLGEANTIVYSKMAENGCFSPDWQYESPGDGDPIQSLTYKELQQWLQQCRIRS